MFLLLLFFVVTSMLVSQMFLPCYSLEGLLPYKVAAFHQQRNSHHSPQPCDLISTLMIKSAKQKIHVMYLLRNLFSSFYSVVQLETGVHFNYTSPSLKFYFDIFGSFWIEDHQSVFLSINVFLHS